MKISPMQLCERVTDGEGIPANIKPGVKKSLANFVGVIRKLRRAAEGVSVFVPVPFPLPSTSRFVCGLDNGSLMSDAQ